MNPVLNLEEELSQALASLLSQGDSSTPSNLAESIRYSLLAPGKRIRPRLTLACAEMLSMDPASVLPSALALEMIHCFTLIHDDLPSMDNDDFRRGRPSNHKVYGEALALLAGDGLFALAFELFSRCASRFPPSAFARALKRFCWAAGPRGVIGGQAAEMLLSPQSSLDSLKRMHALKTGALFQAAILMPADFADLAADSPSFQAIESFAQALGFGFQVADDLEDAEQDAKEEKRKPLSILFHLPPEEATRHAVEPLRASITRLLELHGAKADRLIQIAETVVSRL